MFNRSGSYRPGGVANLESAPEERVYGVLWKLATAELQSLDGGRGLLTASDGRP